MKASGLVSRWVSGLLARFWWKLWIASSHQDLTSVEFLLAICIYAYIVSSDSGQMFYNIRYAIKNIDLK